MAEAQSSRIHPKGVAQTSLQAEIEAAAHELGFALVGFAPLRRLPREDFYAQWLAEGRPGDMAYLARDPERRLDPRRLDPHLRAVISLAFPYQAPGPPPLTDWRTSLRGRIASYALGPDYHLVVLERARALAAEVQRLRPGAQARVYVDTGPVLEREWGRESALGWFGRNTNLINRAQGSYFFLSEIFTDLPLEGPQRDYGEFCGRCTRCLNRCPTGALAQGYRIEPRLCISYLTIELRGPIPVHLRSALGNWVFGCDICQEVCPWNESNGTSYDQLNPSLPELLRLDDAGFRQRFARSAIKRAKRRGLLRNVAVALGNSCNPAAVEVLAESLRTEAEPLVRAHAAWALGNLGGVSAQRTLSKAARLESDFAVAEEIAAALRALPSANRAAPRPATCQGLKGDQN
ncbi:MAG TPA: tRNA epoxyqueuosine(34) reductase QueG [Candidatus Binataceae bacterium]|nr:tRNA epoxyqueuosine(34) reductase QueG [Candidatus Binataceae bacterium]